MSKQLLFVGLAGGLAVAVGLALLFSAISTQSTAQMMNHQGMSGTMESGMTAAQLTDMPWQANQRSMFHASGMSTADNVQITGVSVSGDDEVTVNLRYDGSETSPAITVVAMTNHMAMMGMMTGGSGGGHMGGMMDSGTMGMNNVDNMGMMNGNNMTMMNSTQSMMQPQIGSSVLDAGWTSGATVTVRLEGDGSAYDDSGVHVMVFPLTS
jgi:hypothetical protein